MVRLWRRFFFFFLPPNPLMPSTVKSLPSNGLWPVDTHWVEEKRNQNTHDEKNMLKIHFLRWLYIAHITETNYISFDDLNIFSLLSSHCSCCYLPRISSNLFITSVCERIQSKESESQSENERAPPVFHWCTVCPRLCDNFETAHKIRAKLLTGSDKYSRSRLNKISFTKIEFSIPLVQISIFRADE